MGKPKVISLFSGAGGIDYGLEAAGFRTIAASELNADACRTLRANRPKRKVFEGDIADVPSADLRMGAAVGEVDLVVGGPPCQPFSKAGYWASGDAKRLSDPRARTLDEFLRVVEEVRPRVLMIENVAAMKFAGKSEGVDYLLHRIEAINQRQDTAYRPQHTVLMAADYGVPQLRERFFLVASRDGAPFRFPSPTHHSPDGQGKLLGEPYHTAWDALGDLHEEHDDSLRPTGKWSDLLPSIPEGENYLFHTDRGGGRPLFGWRRRYWSFLLKLAKDRPSWTIQAQPGPSIGPFHWDNRRLSPRELCRLQTFPDSVTIEGSLRAVQKQLGNAVPSLLAEVLGREIRTQLLGLRPLRRQLQLLPERRPPQAARPAEPVHAKYLHLEGDHEAHPGTGRGRRAAQAWSAAE